MWAAGPVWTGTENLASTKTRSRTLQPVACRSTDCAIPAHLLQKIYKMKVPKPGNVIIKYAAVSVCVAGTIQGDILLTGFQPRVPTAFLPKRPPLALRTADAAGARGTPR